MLPVSDLYISIARDPTHWAEHRITIEDAEQMDMSKLISMKITSSMFSDNNPTIGSAVSSHLQMELFPIGAIPEAAKILVESRIVSASLGASEWLPQGIFYFNERLSDDYGAMTVHAYDAIRAFGTDPFLDQASGETGEWPRTMRTVASQIAEKFGTTLDDRCVFNDDLTISYPDNYTCWELLEHIAVAHAGSFVMTKAGKLRLISLGDIPEESSVLIDENGNAITFGGVRIYVG